MLPSAFTVFSVASKGSGAVAGAAAPITTPGFGEELGTARGPMTGAFSAADISGFDPVFRAESAANGDTTVARGVEGSLLLASGTATGFGFAVDAGSAAPRAPSSAGPTPDENAVPGDIPTRHGCAA